MSVHAVARKDGARAYKVRWREHGQNRSRSFKLKKDAEAWDKEVARRRQLGPLAVEQLTTRNGPSLNDWITERWGPEHATTLEQSTRDRYANVYTVHVEPWLGSTPITEITVRQLRAWQAGRTGAGVSAGTIHKCRTLLSSILRHAAEDGAIQANPVSLVRAPKAEQRDSVHPLAPRVVENIRRALVDPPAREIVAVSRHQGAAGGVQVRRRRV